MPLFAETWVSKAPVRMMRKEACKVNVEAHFTFCLMMWKAPKAARAAQIKMNHHAP